MKTIKLRLFRKPIVFNSAFLAGTILSFAPCAWSQYYIDSQGHLGGSATPWHPSYRPSVSNQPTAAQIAYQDNLQGNYAYSKGDWATAISDYQAALQYTPNDSVIKQNLALAQGQLQKAQQAAQAAAIAAQQAAQAAAIAAKEAAQLQVEQNYQNEGEQALQNGDYENAIFYLTKSRDSYSGDNVHRMPWQLLDELREASNDRISYIDGQIAMKHGEYADAAANFSQITPRTSDVQALLDKANSYASFIRRRDQMAGDLLDNVSPPATVGDDASPPATVESSNEQTPSDAAAHIAQKGWEVLQTRDWPVAAAWYQEALQKNPNDPTLQTMAGFTKWLQDKYGDPYPNHFSGGGIAASSGATSDKSSLPSATPPDPDNFDSSADYAKAFAKYMANNNPGDDEIINALAHSGETAAPKSAPSIEDLFNQYQAENQAAVDAAGAAAVGVPETLDEVAGKAAGGADQANDDAGADAGAVGLGAPPAVAPKAVVNQDANKDMNALLSDVNNFDGD